MTRPAIAVAVTLAFALASPSVAGEAEILALLRQAFDAPLTPAELERIEDDPSWDPGRLGRWLHQVAPYPTLEPGLKTLNVPVRAGQTRQVVVRLPEGYDPGKAWPLILAYHPSGGSGAAFLRYVEQTLGERIDSFLIAAPDGYRQTGVDAPPPFTNEHAIVLQQLQRNLHVDADRVYAFGYSLGGYTTWTLAMTLPDRFAAGLAVASTFPVPVADDGIWRLFLPDLREVPLWNVWAAGTACRFPASAAARSSARSPR